MGPVLALDAARPVAAIYRAPLLNASETFIPAQALSLERYQPVFVCRKRRGRLDERIAGRMLIAPRAERLQSLEPRLIHAHFATDGLAALPLARQLGIPLVTTLHGYDVSRSQGRMLLSGRVSWTRYALGSRRLIADGDLFLAVSEAIRGRAIRRGFPPERTFTHFIGVDLERFRPGGAPEPGLILHVGRLVEKKGTADLLDALVGVRRRVPSAHLVVAGDGPLRPALERRCAELGLVDAVRFIGFCPHDEITAWMQRAWVLAAPSVTAADGDSEGLPTVLVEAAACATPAVGTAHSGIPEAVVDGRTGFVVAEHDVAALGTRLADLLTHPDLRGRMGRAARRLAEERFDLARQTSTLEDHYDRVVAAYRSV